MFVHVHAKKTDLPAVIVHGQAKETDFSLFLDKQAKNRVSYIRCVFVHEQAKRDRSRPCLFTDKQRKRVHE